MTPRRKRAVLALLLSLFVSACAVPNPPPARSRTSATVQTQAPAAARTAGREARQPQRATGPATAPAPAAREIPVLGIQVQPIAGIDMRSLHMQYGRWQVITVAAVTPGGLGEAMGLRADDVLLSANYREIKSPEELQAALAPLGPGDRVVLLLSRKGEKARFVHGSLAGGAAAHAAAPGPAVQAAPETRIFAPTGHHRILSLAVSADGRQLLTGGDAPNTLKLWDLATGREGVPFAGTAGKNLYAVALSPDGRHALSGGEDQTVRLWETATGRLLKTLSGHGGMVLSVAFSPDGRQAASGSRDHRIKLWDLASGRELRTLSGHGDGVKALAYAADGRRLLSGSFDKTLKLWDTATGGLVRTLTGHDWQVASVALSPDGRTALSRSGDRIVKLWNLETGRAIRTFSVDDVDAKGVPLGNQMVVSGAFSPDGRFLLTTNRQGTIKLWDVAAGKAVRVYAGHTGWAQAVAFTGDMRRIVSGGNDGTLRLWDLATGREIAQALSLQEGEWIVLTREGYYNASQNGHRYLNIRLGPKVYGIDQFYDVFYRPDIVAAKLRGEAIDRLVTLTLDEAIQSPPPAVAFDPLPAQTDQARLQVCYRVTGTGGGIGEVRLFHNGKLIESDGYYREVARVPQAPLTERNGERIYAELRGIEVKAAEAGPVRSAVKGDPFTACRTVEAVPGENEVSLAAFNQGNTVQSALQTARFNALLPPVAPRLYLLAIGIDRYRDPGVSLRYALKDAREISARLTAQAATLFAPERIHPTLLADGEATKARILERIDALARQITPADSFILFVAGHGVLLQNQYFMLTHDYAGTADEASLISANEIVEMSKRIRSLSQLLIFDTCHAGGVDAIVSGLYDARMSVLAKKMGLHVYASASDRQAALDGYRGNGLFTHTLLEGLDNNRQADRNGEGRVTIVGLGAYARQRTAALSREIGHSQTPLMIHFGKDAPLYTLR